MHGAGRVARVTGHVIDSAGAPDGVDPADWFVLLIGGSSGVGKTTVAPEIARRLGVAWLMVDDLRLALERSGVPIPDSTRVEEIDAPGGLVAVGEAVAPAIEVVIENHVDQRVPVVIEGDGILPSILDRPPVRARAAGGRVRAVFVQERDPDALHADLLARGADGWREDVGWYARRSVAHGEWLAREAARRGVPTVPARPRDTLADRVLAAARLARGPESPAAPRLASTPPDPPTARRRREPAIEIRPIAPDERAELLAAARRYWLDLMPRWRGNRDLEHQAAYFAGRFRLGAEESMHWWAIAHGARVGFAKVDLAQDQDGRWADWRDFYVEAGFRRRGYGRAFARAVIAWLAERGCHRIDLNVRQDNPTALTFWRSLGFELALYRMRMYLPG
ncbi:MAG TPA: GNAT family N-acetyltransferase [Solirubrobacteraceae bacterium]|jgi:ribosomal protein S18 acetylase RimI-like enzyme/predicted kinase